VLRSRLVALGLVAIVVLAVRAPGAGAFSLTSFSSPSTNIGCEIFDDGGHWIARCDIRDRDWAPPRAPKRCRLDYGQGVYVGSAGRAGYVCAGDTALGPKRILNYGDSLSRGPIKCLSLTIGMRCNDIRDGHGFLISREVVKLY
jgi:hypothetical protein